VTSGSSTSTTSIRVWSTDPRERLAAFRRATRPADAESHTNGPPRLASAPQAGSPSGGIHGPLTAIRGLGAETVRHILQMRAMFGPFTSLLDFLRRMDPHQISRRELQLRAHDAQNGAPMNSTRA
jgi:hypothetical protein